MTIVHNNKADDQGRPAGGCTHGRGFTIAWQDGSLAIPGTDGGGPFESTDCVTITNGGHPYHDGPCRKAPNGAFVEDIIAAAIGRLEFYQASPFACDENAEAIGYLNGALAGLGARTTKRTARGVEGTLVP